MTVIPFPHLLDLARVGIWQVDQTFCTVCLNDQMARMLGVRRDQMKARAVMDFIPPEDHDHVRELWERRLSDVGESHDIRFRRADGSLLWALLTGAPIHDHHGQVTGALALVLDVSAQKLVEQRERLQRRMMELVAQDLPLGECLTALMNLTASLYPGTQVALLVPPTDRPADPADVVAASQGAGDAADILRAGAPPGADTAPVSPPDSRPLQQEVQGPDGLPYLLVALLSRATPAERESLTELLKATALALQFAFSRALTLAQLHQSHSRLEERVALKTQESRRQAMAMEASIEGMAILQNGRYAYMNPAHARMYGYTPSELIGESWERLYEGAERQRIEAEAYPMMKASGHWAGEAQGRRADGSLFDVEVSLTLCPSGEIICTCRDITHRKQQAEALRRNEEQLSRVLTATEDGFWDLDVPSGQLTMSPRWLEMLGYQAGELIPHIATWENLIHPDDRERVAQQVADLLAGRITYYQNEHRLRSKSGAWQWILTRGKVVDRDPSGRALRAVGVHSDVTDRHQLQEILATVLEAGEIGFWDHQVDKNRVERRGNGYQRLGYEPGDIPASLEGLVELIHPAERTSVMESYARFLANPEGRWDQHFRMRGRMGNYRWIFTRAKAVEHDPQGHSRRVIGIHLDVHERQTELSQIQWQGRQLESIGDVQRRFLEGEETAQLFDSLLGTVLQLTESEYGFIAEVLVDQGMPYMRTHALTNIAWNEETRRLYEQARKNGMEFRNLQTLFGQVLVHQNLILANDAPNDPRRGGLPPGHPPLRRFCGIPVFSGGELVGVIGLANRPEPYAEEITHALEPLIRTYGSLITSLRREAARQRTDAELQRRTHDLIETNAALQRAARGRDEFLASMSHELRTPLTSMLALTEVLRDGLASPLNPAQSRHVQLIDESSRHLLDLINDVLEVAQLEARLVRVQPVPCHVRDMVEAAVRLLRGQAQAKRIFLHVHPGPDQLHVLADPLRLKQMLTNLLSNAIKFTLPGGQVGVRVTVDDAAVHFCVEDTGIGIEPEKMALLFQPFVQIESGLARRYGGSGLGLVIVKRFAELLAGSVAVESTPGRGSRFTVSLPVHRSAHLEPTPDPTQPTAAPPPQPAEAPVPAVRVLVVEDNELNRSVLADYLSARGFEVATAENGLDALNQIAAVQPQVVVMDIQMPEIDGLEVSRRIRQMSDPKISQVSILALTALAMPGDRERCLAAGVTDYLSKPFTLKDLDRCLREMAATSTSLGR